MVRVTFSVNHNLILYPEIAHTGEKKPRVPDATYPRQFMMCFPCCVSKRLSKYQCMTYRLTSRAVSHLADPAVVLTCKVPRLPQVFGAAQKQVIPSSHDLHVLRYRHVGTPDHCAQIHNICKVGRGYFTNVLYFYIILSLAHTPHLRIFYSWSKHKRIRTVRQDSGRLAHPRGLYYNGKGGRWVRAMC